MKTVIIILVFFVSVAAGYFGYSSLQPKTSLTSIAIDKTDTDAAQIVSNEIVTNHAFTESMWNRHTVRIVSITGYDINPTVSITLPGAMALFSSPVKRQDEIAQFIAQVKSAIDSITAAKTDQPQSVIYKQLVNELNAQSSERADQKRLWVFSDLNENNPQFSVYNAHSRRLLNDSPAAVQRAFQQTIRLHDLHGIDVMLIHQVRNANENNCYVKMATVFRSVFSEAGATVKITATLEN